jgi:uncharacterized protein DUF2382
VPVSREEVRLEREPIIDANRGDAMSGRRHHRGRARSHPARRAAGRVEEGRLVERLPVERVRLGAEMVTENHKVTETLRQVQIDEPGVAGEAKR